MQTSTAAAALPDTSGPYLREAFLDWERLRLVYNLILSVQALRMGHSVSTEIGMAFIPLGILLAAFLMFANIFFCLGPLLEFYFHALVGIHLYTKRRIVFLAGLGTSLLLLELLGGQIL